MLESHPHAYCSGLIHEEMASYGVEVVVTVRIPPDDRPHIRSAVCAHGITYWVYPSDGQLDEWKRIGMNP